MMSIQDMTLAAGDGLFDWVMLLPGGFRLIVVAFLTSILFTGCRRLVCDQKLLGMMDKDLKRIKLLLAAARRSGDKDSVARYRDVSLMMRRKVMKAQSPALLLALLPLLLLGNWAWNNLALEWPAPGAAVEVRLLGPSSSAGEMIHLVPGSGIQSEKWITLFDASSEFADRAEARWMIIFQEGSADVDLLFRSESVTLTRNVRRKSSAFTGVRLMRHPGGWQSLVMAKEARAFGVLPGIPWLGLPAWALGYVLLVIVMNPLLKRTLRVY